MVEFEVCSDAPDLAEIERLLAAQGLSVSLRTTLRAYPGGTHWHLLSPGLAGTLELTLFEGRLWFKIASNREADWMQDAMEQFRDEVRNLK